MAIFSKNNDGRRGDNRDMVIDNNTVRLSMGIPSQEIADKRARLESDIAEYLKNGGKIEVVPGFETTNRIDHGNKRD